MGNIYYAIPSARPPEEAIPVLRRWKERGYRVVLQRDIGASLVDPSIVEIQRQYAGYAEAVNHLCRHIIEVDPQAEWIVTGGDDILPDPNHSAEEIAQQCAIHFRDMWTVRLSETCAYAPICAADARVMGVMQPTGDREFGDAQGPYIDRVAGSPWIGREFARRMYGGRGPLCEEYWHCGEDEELQSVATMMGVFWQRPDLIHEHRHWGRPKPGQRMAINPTVPAFLERANSAAEWAKFQRIFAERRANNWPGHEPIL